MFAKFCAVLLVDTASIKDPGLVGNLVTDTLEPVTNGLVHLLSLLGGGNLASSNSPDGLVSDDDLGPVADLGFECLKLLGHDIDRLASLTLLEALATAPDDAEAILSGILGLGGDDFVRLLENGTALRVT